MRSIFMPSIWGVVAVRRFVVVAIATCLLLVPATAALARGDGWEFLPAPPPFEIDCGSTGALVTIVVDREYGRSIDEPDGSTVLQITGSLVANYTSDTASITVNTGGPGKITFYQNGDVEIHAEGLNTENLSQEQAVDLGTPQVFLSKGLLDFVVHPDGSATPVRIPTNIRDIGAELGCY
jgi:hypothetical protein